MKANSDKSKQSKKATRRVLAGVLCGASVLSLVLSLVMPPISQAIANDAQTVSTEETVMGGGSSGESTGVDNTANGDAENQNSDDAENGASEDAVTEGQPSDDTEAEGDARPADDSANGEGAIALAAENESTYEISSGDELSAKLLDTELRDATGSATFKLVADIEYNGEIKFEQTDDNPINITLYLNGHKIKCLNSDKPLFDVAGGATLTIKDSINDSEQASETVDAGQPITDQGQNLEKANYGKKAELTYGDDGIPSNLTYYVTKSSPNGTRTTETLFKHGVDIKGAIVACGGNANLKLINLYNKNGKGGTFNLESGVVTQKQDSSVGSLVYAEGGSTVNMSGGYVCGASGSGVGAGIRVSNIKGGASTLYVADGVIAGNSAPNGGGVYAEGSTVAITGGVISGNSTRDSDGFGGGIMASGGSVTVSGGYITNNKYAKFCGEDGNGDHGGAGLAANNGAHVTISGGQITGNYSEEAGGGVYVTDVGRQGSSRKDTAWLNITGGTIASNVSFRSEGAGIRVGQMVDAMINGTPDSNGTLGRKVYITNNYCMSRFDWGGGGIFVQGCNENASYAGRLFVYNSYISSNTAGGYGGGVAVCPTGKTLVTNTEGTAIFDNSSAGAEHDEVHFQDGNAYNKEKNTGNELKPHLSGGGSGKNQDQVAYGSEVFRTRGHADFFLAASAGHSEPIAAVIGKMLGGGDAKYSGSKERSDNKEPSDNNELYEAINIPANGGVKIYRSVGLSSGVTAGSDEANKAQEAAGTFITGNYSWDHGGGIMSNGDLYLGQPADTYVYPSLKLKATKELNGRDLKDGEFSFTVYRKDSNDPFAKGTFNRDACTKVGTANNDAHGNITFNLGEQFAANGTADTITYYLVENAGTDSDITYDPAVYEIAVTVKDHTTVLMHVPTRDDPNSTIELKIHNYTIDGMTVTKHSGDSTSVPRPVQADSDGYYYVVVGSNGEKTFTNKYNPYTSSGSWTPKATKVVEGGEMKEFTLEFADNENFTGDSVKTVSTTAGGDKSQPLGFPTITYTLDSLKQSNTDVPGRGASKTFTYYMREKNDSSIFSHYKFDQSVYRFNVVATDNTKGGIDCAVTYRKGTVNSNGEWTADANTAEETFTDTSFPTFTNTYSTSLPLSGMSGVTLTYLAGAAVLCAAAAWMHIRRKANAKGDERRE